MIIYDKNDKYLVIPTGLGNLNTGVAVDGDIDPCEGLYEDGYEDGYDTGFDEGKTEGTAEGYQNGYNTGNAEGYQNGYQTGDAEGFERGKTEGVAEYESSLNQLNVTENGRYNGVFKNAYVNVPQMTAGGKKNMDGTVDVDGLRAIGWDDESIQMLQDNTNFYSWQNYEWQVNYSDKDLYGVINTDNRDDYQYNASPVFLPYFDTINVTDMNNFLGNYTKTKGIPKLNTSDVNNMYNMFYNCSSLTSIPELNTRNVTDMNEMFNGCSSLTSIPELDTSNVTDMNAMFNGCSSLTSIPELDTSNVTDMSNMFNGCSVLTSIPDFDTSNVTEMSLMFSGCSKLTSIPYFDTSKVNGMYGTFYNCKALTSIPELNTRNVTRMNEMFYGCSKLESLPRLNCSNVTNMNDFFGPSYADPDNLTELGGFIGLKTTLDLSNMSSLTGESIVNVMNYLSTTPNTGAVLRLPSNARTKYDEVKSEGSFNQAVESLTSVGWTIQV